MDLKRILLSGIGLSAALAPAALAQGADFVFRGGAIYTMNEAAPWAHAVVVEDGAITAVLAAAAEAAPYIDADTEIIDLGGRMLLPGFIDGHTHFASAGALINDANLLRVADDAGLRAEIARVTGLLAPGEWITGGLWGAYEDWAQGAAAADASGRPAERWRPTRRLIDDLTTEHPVFIRSFDRDPARRLYLANALALEAAELMASPLPGMELGLDGTPTGLIDGASPAVAILEAAVKPKSAARLLDENRAALKRLAEAGVVEIHDITNDAQMARYVALQEAGELSVRVWARADLSRAAEFNERGLKMGRHPVTGERDLRLRWGAYKGYIDGIMGNHSALFFEPYADQPENYGHYRHHTSDAPDFSTPNMEKIYGYLAEARRGGFVANVHAIGTKGVALMLDTYERLMAEAGQKLEGYRVIHAQVIRPQDFPRFRELGVYAEVNPYHLSDDMRWMEERIGHERAKGAYAFRSLIDNGADLVFGSDWPGTNAAEYAVHPAYLIHAAVNRTTVNHEPKGGWFPEQKITIEEALRAYTINGARAAFDGETRGSIEPGKRADLVILDRNLFDIPPEEILETQVDLTMVDGEIVFRRNSD
ncbi:MAG: amidohydrolase [Parvularculaceae bacterium]